MENKMGGLVRPSSKNITVKERKRPVFLVGLLVVLLIVSYVFIVKTYEPVKNVLITGSILVYPLTFLVVSYISKYYGFKEARKSIFISTGLFVIFILLMMICVIPQPNNQTSSYNAVIQYLYTNDFILIGEDTRIYFPLLGQFFGMIIAYITSHLLYATIYNAIHNYTIDYLAMGLSVFIAAIIDRIIFMPILYLENLLNGSNTFDYFVKCLTSEFIATIITAVLSIIIYMILTMIVDSIKKKHQDA